MKHIKSIEGKGEPMIKLLNDESKLVSAKMEVAPDIWCVADCHADCHLDCVMCY